MTKPFLSVLNGQKTDKVPFWLMRQAGRYLPEYRALREKAGGFLNLAFNPAWAAEVTVQPLRRYGMDAAILFSDILVVPLALGKELRFETGEGPRLETVRAVEEIPTLDEDAFDKTMTPVYEAIGRVRQMLRDEGFDQTALIGFAGAPWTVATYMVEGGSSRTFPTCKAWLEADADGFARLIAMLTDATIRYLSAQIEAGAEAIQIFDSWAVALVDDAAQYERFVVEPARRIVAALRRDYPHIPVIGFPRGSCDRYADYAKKTGVQALGLDQAIDPFEAAKIFPASLTLQGNLAPEILLAGGDEMTKAAEIINEAWCARPYVFNLGHGVIKETPPENVAALADIIKSW